ncbi:hypothetical protein C0991_005997 [Blastosporella zonata]|nr:hypothetical protein C0991_005997 [Blastosporella zonata]
MSGTLMFSNPIRQPARLLAVCRRYKSTQATSHRQQHVLSDDKLRSLISLYHQSKTFITLDNLSQRIDDAFLQKESGVRYSTSVQDLEHALKGQRKQAKISEWDEQVGNKDVAPNANHDSKWSQIKRGREQKVKQALYGLDDEENLPGVEVLKDAVTKEGRLPRQLESDVRDLLEEQAH